MSEQNATFVVRCINCQNKTVIDSETTENSEHTPKSKALTLQARTSNKCDKCGEVRMGVSKKEEKSA